MPFSKCMSTSISLFIQKFADRLQKTLNPADRSNRKQMLLSISQLVIEILSSSELWPTCMQQERKANSFHMRCLRNISGSCGETKSETTLFCSSPIVAPCLVIAKQDGCTGLVTFAGLLSAVYQKTFSILN